ncbi:acyltransferase family protein [Labedella endophytica]|uniref:Acyltransferase n=1 Tax=Labedella endophytica TaxID=1523160 RepID=A0A3S0VFZ9_9MICO|nr:acyltransferase [Labedella endophytica]RUR00783.1 acyltransferase [Labedella endophytica]
MTSSLETAAPKKRFKGLQGLRFFAAVSVVAHHSMFYAHERLDDGFPVWGIGAVELFFAISGFVAVVSSRSVRDRVDGWKYYVVRRGIRILPMYWLATTVKLITLFALPAAVLHAELNWGNIGLSYFLLPSENIDGTIAPLLGVAWTLLYEAFFTIVFMLALLVPRVNPFWFSGIVLSLFALGSLFRPEDYSPFAVYFDPILLYFVIGMVIGRFAQSRRVRPLLLGLAVVVALHVVTDLPGGVNLEQQIRLVVIAGLLIGVMFAEPWLDKHAPNILVHLGNASFSLYLIHPIVAPVVPEVLNIIGLQWPILSTILSVLGALVAALILYRFVENPVTLFLQRKLRYGTIPRKPARAPSDAADVGGGEARRTETGETDHARRIARHGSR